MLPVAALVSSVVLLLGGGVAARTVQAEPAGSMTLSISGRGWGHGIGMSQWGAYGFARRGTGYRAILTHYYRGTQIGKVGGTPMRVLLADGAGSVTVGSAGPLTVKDAAGDAYELPAGSYQLGSGLKLKVDPDQPARELQGPLVFSPNGSPLTLAGRRYRGTLEIAVDKGRLRAVNTVGLEAYLLGVVPAEVPSHWPAEALKAQAVAARSYALATRKPSGPFDAYADVRSQVYLGIDHEKPQTTAAVRATAREVVLYQGKVATTYFFSTSGGKTANIEEVWPRAQPVPYLVSVKDPHDGASPHHKWGPVSFGPQALRKALKLPATPVDVRVATGASGRVTRVVFTLTTGGQTSIPAATIRTELGLRSTWFRVGVLALRPPAKGPVTFGTKARLGGTARGVAGPVLERRSPGGGWERVAKVAAAKDGSFAVPFRAQRTTEFRLVTAGGVTSAPVRVRVAPNVKLRAADEPGMLRGSVRPVLPGAVALQRLSGGSWTGAGTAPVDDRGAFQVAVDRPGTYRARVAARAGYTAGVSGRVSVEP